MESLIIAAARALEAGDPLGALNRVALRNDAPSLALRGIAMAQLGDLAKAKTLLRSAARAFGLREAVARARCVVAEAEIPLVSRDLSWPAKMLAAARAALARAGNAARLSRIPALAAEVDSASLILNTPAARLIARGSEHPLLLGEVERLATSTALVVDTFHHVVRRQGVAVSLGTRPVLFALARLLAH